MEEQDLYHDELRSNIGTMLLSSYKQISSHGIAESDSAILAVGLELIATLLMIHRDNDDDDESPAN